MKEIRLIKKWLKIEGNTQSLLAERLGYSSRSTINNWIKYKRIPDYMKQSIMEICK